MGDAKQIIVRPISAQDARRIVSSIHYSGTTVNNSQIHLGVFIGDACGGAMQFGPSLDKGKLVGLVDGTGWNEFIELNRMAFADWLPRNSESRAIGYAMRLLRGKYPWLKWVVSFADATQCGDGTIYRASGFVLTGIKANTQIWKAPEGEGLLSRMSLTDGRSKQKQKEASKIAVRTSVTKGRHASLAGGGASMKPFKDAGFKPLPGFQLRYVYFLDRSCREKLTVAEIPFSEIESRGASMYLGKSIKRAGGDTKDTPADQVGEGGSTPTPALQTDYIS